MVRNSSNKGVEFVTYKAYCNTAEDTAELKSVRIWQLYTGRNVIPHYGEIRCSRSLKCNCTHGCLLSAEAIAEWEAEANEIYDEVREEMLSW